MIWWPVSVFLATVPTRTVQLYLENCNEALGLSDGRLSDSAMRASSSYDPLSVGPQNARLHSESNGGAWCPLSPISRHHQEYIEIDLGGLHVITALLSQGRFDKGRGQEYTEAYKIEYFRFGFSNFREYRDSLGRSILSGNTNTYGVANNTLKPSIVANKLRLFPYSEHPRTVCLRLELLGCFFKEGVTAYSIPQGMVRGALLELMDHTYDGIEDAVTGNLREGLGQLVDGRYGLDNFKASGQHGLVKGYDWLGWKKKANSDSLNLTFAFHGLRIFHRLDIHVNNHFSKDIVIFSEANVYFSNEEGVFKAPPSISFRYMRDNILENARNVSIHLKEEKAQYVCLQLFFAGKWILISEITFISDSLFDRKRLSNTSDHESPLHVNITSIPAHGDNDEKNFMKESSQVGILIGILITFIFLLLTGISIVSWRSTRENPSKSLNTRFYKASFVTVQDSEEAIYEEPSLPLYSTVSGFLSLPNTKNEYSQNIYSQPIFHKPSTLSLSHYSRPESRPPTSDSSTTVSMQSPHLSVTSKKTDGNSPSVFEDTIRGNEHLSNMKVLGTLSPGPSFDFDTQNVTVPQVERKDLKVLEKLGEGLFGEIHLCIYHGSLVAVKSLKSQTGKDDESDDSSSSRVADFEHEARILATLTDNNLVRVLGVSFKDGIYLMICEYTNQGDLYSFLQDHVAETTLSEFSSSAPTLSYGCLIYLASQIASGMKYLESLNFVHRDLATRNCLIQRTSSDLIIKIADFGMSRSIYQNDYYKSQNGSLLPIRWMSWESVLLAQFTSKSDVWSFGVTFWEILTFAREQPYEDLSDEKVISSLSSVYQIGKPSAFLSLPFICPRDVRDLMNECWQRNDKERPSFNEIHLFLQRKNLGYSLKKDLFLKNHDS